MARAALTTRVAVTTIARGTPVDAPGGRLRIVELDSGAQEEVAPLPDAVHRARDPNPRGGLRGGRGIAATEQRLAVAINDRILVLDRRWSLDRVISHRWMGGVHDIAADGSGLWAACADNDLLLRLDWSGRLLASWHWRTDRRLCRALGHGWLPGFDRWPDHRDPLGGGFRLDVGHINAVARDGDALLVGLGLVRPRTRLGWAAARARGGRLLERVGLGPATAEVIGALSRSPDLRSVTPGQVRMEEAAEPRPGWTFAVLELRRGPHGWRRPRWRLVARHPSGGVPTHNVVLGNDVVVVNHSASGRVLALDRADGEVVRSVQLPGRLPFPRGLVKLDRWRYLVGTQGPATLTLVDLGAERVEARIPLEDDQGEAPYGIATVPNGFETARGRLPRIRRDWGIVGADASAEGSA